MLVDIAMVVQIFHTTVAMATTAKKKMVRMKMTMNLTGPMLDRLNDASNDDKSQDMEWWWRERW